MGFEYTRSPPSREPVERSKSVLSDVEGGEFDEGFHGKAVHGSIVRQLAIYQERSWPMTFSEFHGVSKKSF
jgi:hypothetical protein